MVHKHSTRSVVKLVWENVVRWRTRDNVGGPGWPRRYHFQEKSASTLITKTPFIYGHNVTKRLDTRFNRGLGNQRERRGETRWNRVEHRGAEKPVQCTTARHNLIPKSLERPEGGGERTRDNLPVRLTSSSLKP